MQVLLRPATATDAAACGRICYEAFSTVAKAYGFPMDWRSEEAAVKVIEARLAHRFTYGVVAEVGGKIAGTRLQGDDIGRLMMEHLLERARTEGITGTRLVQAAYNMHSLALYTKLGFQVRDLLACLHGEPISMRMRGYPVHLGTEDDLPACDALCTRLHGYARTEDLLEALPLRTLTVVTRDGRACGYSTGAHFRGHTVAETNEDARALIAAAEQFPEPGLLMPAGNGELLRWALDHGLRITQPLSLMTRGFYRQPEGAFLPSIHA